MKFTKIAVFALIVLGSGILLMSSFKSAKSTTTVPTKIVDGKTWHTIEELPALQKTKPKKVLVDIYTDWCRWCQVMDQTTFSDAQTMAHLKDNYYLVKLNAETATPLTFKGKSYKYVKGGRRGYNELAAKLLQGQLSYPSFVVLDEQLNTVEVIKGYKDAKAFKLALDKIAL